MKAKKTSVPPKAPLAPPNGKAAKGGAGKVTKPKKAKPWPPPEKAKAAKLKKAQAAPVVWANGVPVRRMIGAMPYLITPNTFGYQVTYDHALVGGFSRTYQVYVKEGKVTKCTCPQNTTRLVRCKHMAECDLIEAERFRGKSRPKLGFCHGCGRDDVLLFKRDGKEPLLLSYHNNKRGVACPVAGVPQATEFTGLGGLKVKVGEVSLDHFDFSQTHAGGKGTLTAKVSDFGAVGGAGAWTAKEASGKTVLTIRSPKTGNVQRFYLVATDSAGGKVKAWRFKPESRTSKVARVVVFNK